MPWPSTRPWPPALSSASLTPAGANGCTPSSSGNPASTLPARNCKSSAGGTSPVTSCLAASPSPTRCPRPAPARSSSENCAASTGTPPTATSAERAALAFSCAPAPRSKEYDRNQDASAAIAKQYSKLKGKQPKLQAAQARSRPPAAATATPAAAINAPVANPRKKELIVSSSAETPGKPGAALPRSEFPPIYYDSPVTQVVARVPVKGAGEVKAEITAGGEFFKVDRVQVKVIDDALAELGGRGRPGRLAELSVTAEVPKASAPAPGPFNGTVVLTGPGVNETVQLEGTYLGTLIGQVTVQPKTAVPGEPVLLRVLRGDGELQSDPAVTVNIAGVTAV